MADLAGTVVGAVSFGLQLATTLQTFAELAIEAEDALRDIVFEVNATAAALRQLQTIVDADKAIPDAQRGSRVFTESGLHEVETLAVRCEKVYRTIIRLVLKASSSTTTNTSETDGRDAKPLGAREALDASSLKPMNLLRRLRWPWLIPRINRCQEQLRWLKISLLVTLQLASLAQDRIRSDEALSTETDVWTRQAIETLWKRQALLPGRPPQAAYVKPASSGAAVTTPHGVLGQDTAEVDAAQHGRFLSRALAGQQLHAAPSMRSKQSRDGEKDVKGQCDANEGGRGSLCSVKGEKHLGGSIPHKSPPTSDAKGQWTRPVHGGSSVVVDKEHRRLPPNTLSLPTQFADTAHTSRSNPFTQCFSGAIGRNGVLRAPGVFLDDWPSESLQAFIVEHGDIKPVPLGHRSLEHSLARAVKSQRLDTWSQYLEADSGTQALLVEVTDSARRATNRTVALVAFQPLQRRKRPDALIAFFSLKDVLEPVQFVDATGRKFTVPFGACHAYEDFTLTILDLVGHNASIATAVRAGSFELCNEAGETIHPTLWAGWIRPGAIVSLNATRISTSNLPDEDPREPAAMVCPYEERADIKPPRAPIPTWKRAVGRPIDQSHKISESESEPQPEPERFESDAPVPVVTDEEFVEAIENGNVELATAIQHARRRRRNVLGRLVGSVGTALSKSRRRGGATVKAGPIDATDDDSDGDGGAAGASMKENSDSSDDDLDSIHFDADSKQSEVSSLSVDELLRRWTNAPGRDMPSQDS
ncbi:low molecular weight phosphotyrosine protein phosphatase [Purpureocillium lavendulum]|uniref:Low molecular weight phosphotyrosine protein phosphatase n=1 Tax=Purpureocillium lavendulum TaxID=1247861 RepID=A0AB34FDD4_9HYPO|nr:low molecular weight phosphotyrosine protein phosphatase [Purpureocillium lavendulum]